MLQQYIKQYNYLKEIQKEEKNIQSGGRVMSVDNALGLITNTLKIADENNIDPNHEDLQFLKMQKIILI